MNAAVVEIMEQAACGLPAAHSDEGRMAVLAVECTNRRASRTSACLSA